MKIKLFVSDIDGTLLQLPEGIPESTLQLIRMFKNRGNFFTLCTGRSIAGTRDVAKAVDLDVPAIVMTGSVIYDFSSERLICAHSLHESYSELITECAMKQPDIAVVVNTLYESYRIKSNLHLEKRGTLADREAPIASLNAVKNEAVYKILIVHQDHATLRQLERFIGKRFDGVFNVNFASRHFVEIVSADAGKDKALQELANILNVSLENTHYAGDGLTDLPAMLAAGTSSAPKNAPLEVKKAADWLFPAAEKHGLNEMLSRVLNSEHE